MSLQSSRLWSTGEKLLFRFFFVFFVLYISPLSFIPWIGTLYESIWQQIVPWAGEHILHLPEPIKTFTNGSGDTTYDYVKLLIFFMLSVAIAAVWSLADGRRKDYNVMHHWLSVGLRYYMAFMMCVYGFSKIYHMQMPFPFLSQLVQPFGDKSPMGLAWSYVGFSSGFSAFTGWAEVIAGTLLLFRRTVLLGAVLCAMVMLNIVMINFCFDVPVKIYSSFLLLLSFFLMAPDLKRMADLFVLNKTVQPKVFRNYLSKRWMRVSAIVIKVLVIGVILYSQVAGNRARAKQFAMSPPLYGIYNTELFVRNHDTIPPLLTDTTRWRQMIIQRVNNAQIKLMNDSLKSLFLDVDEKAKTATITKYDNVGRQEKNVLRYTADSAYLTLTGVLDNDTILYRFKKYDTRNFRLVSRGFRWVNETPYNR